MHIKEYCVYRECVCVCVFLSLLSRWAARQPLQPPEAHARSTADGLITALVISVSSPCPLTSLPFSDGSHRGFEAFDPFCFPLSLSLYVPAPPPPPAEMTPRSLACHRRDPARVGGGGENPTNHDTLSHSLSLSLLLAPLSTLGLPHFRRLAANNNRHEVTSPR